ncbi:MAG: hypothetical protein IPL27_13625 [Lewinellaceae bacterium]|nr:hypothetical protein [Lewinellaceae bacterium]
MSTLSLGGEHKIGRATLDYQVFVAYAREQEPDRLEAEFESPGQAIATRFNLDDPEYTRAEFPNANNAPNATDYDNFELDNLLLENRKVRDVNYTPRINLTLPYILNANNSGYIKFGGKIRAKNKERNIESQQFAAYFENRWGTPAKVQNFRWPP